MLISRFSIFDWIGPASRTLPTTDLYFLNACRLWLDQRPFHPAPIKRVGQNSFVCRDAIIISRRDKAAVVDQLLRQGRKRLYYIIDDNLWAVEEDTAFPEAYRQRLIALREGQHKLLIERAETIVVSSPTLADIYRQRGHEVVQLDPYWSEPFADSSHFDVLAQGGPLEIGYLGGPSHATDRAFVFQVFENLIALDANIRLTVTSAADVPDHLKNHKKLRILKHLPWPRYRKRLIKQRFHLLLYPTLPTAFNQARSFNKLLEHAVVGGVGAYSDTWKSAHGFDMSKSGLFLENKIGKWSNAISLVDGVELSSNMKVAKSFASKINTKSISRQLLFWKEALLIS